MFLNNAKCKRRFTIVLIVILYIISCVTVFAHPGRTDENGGHWDRKNGTYHFHTGEYAGQSSSYSVPDRTYEPFTPPYDLPTVNPYRTEPPKETENTDNHDEILKLCIDFVVLFILIVVISFIIEFMRKLEGCFFSVLAVVFVYVELWCMVICFGYFIILVVSCLEEYPIPLAAILITAIIVFVSAKIIRRNINITVEKYEACINLLKNRSERLNDIRNDIKNSFVKIPDEYEIGADELPKEKNNISWGATFTLYKTKSGNKLHRLYGCCSADIPVHAYKYSYYKSISSIMCKRCGNNYELPDFEWYKQYLSQLRLENEYESLKKQYEQQQETTKLFYRKCNRLYTKLMLMFNKKLKNTVCALNKEYKIQINEK